jgi:hypothetical protein
MIARGLCAAAVVAAPLIGAAGASAELPEVGRCLKVESGGKYKNDSCTTAATANEGHWEWSPGSGATGTGALFEGVRGNPSGFETVGGTKIYCTDQWIEGKWTGPRTALINELAFYPCDLQTHPPTEGGPNCLTDGLGEYTEHPLIDAETIRIDQPVEAELGFIERGTTTPKVGLKIKSPVSLESPMFAFFCGGVLSPEMRVPQLWTISGEAIGSAKPVDKMTEEQGFEFDFKKGTQVPEHFESGSPAVLTAHIEGADTSRTEQVGIRYYPLAKTAEPIEVKAK